MNKDKKNTYKFNELITAIKKKQLAIFVGAGISINSGIPGAKGVVEILKKRYPEKFREIRKYEYSEAFNMVFPGEDHQKDRRSFIEELCSGKIITEEHKLIAHLVEQNKIHYILTTNFDHLIEHALMSYCSTVPGIYLYDEEIELMEFSDKNPKLLKLHGDFLRDDLANLDDETRRRVNEGMRIKITSYLRNRGLIVLGYGGNDDSIMNLLEETAKTPEGMKYGLWWVIYEESDLYKNDKLKKVIEIIKQQKKPIEIIGPIDVVNFLRKIYSSLKIQLPKPILFGIHPKKTNIVDIYIGKFKRARQLPPIEDKEINRSLKIDLQKLEEKIKEPGIIWLNGNPLSGKSTLVGALFKKYSGKENKLFYFSPRFSRKPVNFNLRNDLYNFADSLGLNVPQYYFIDDLLKDIFKKGSILILDDIYSQNYYKNVDLTKLTSLLFKYQIYTGKGNIISIPSYKLEEDFFNRLTLNIMKNIAEKHNKIWMPPHSFKVSIIDMPFNSKFFQNLNSKESSQRKQLYEYLKTNFLNISDKYLRAFNIMSQLRFAESNTVLGILTGILRIQEILEYLHQNLLIEKRGNKYIMREFIQSNVCKIISTPELHSEIALGFEKISEEHLPFERIYFTIESEYHYWMAGKIKEAAIQILAIGDWLMNFDNRLFLYKTLKEYFQINGWEEIIASLHPSLQFKLLGLLYESYKSLNLKEFFHDPSFDYFYLSARKKIFSNLDDWAKFYFIACECYTNNNLKGYQENLIKSEQILEKETTYKVLGDIQLKISGSYYDLASIYESTNLEINKMSLNWAKKAEKTYLRVGYQAGIAEARINIASGLLSQGKIKEAIRIVKKEIITHYSQQGFSHEKAVGYGNLFFGNILLGNIQEAEGYFHEGNSNYAMEFSINGLLKNYSFLFEILLKRNDSDNIKNHLNPKILYNIIIANAINAFRDREATQAIKLIHHTIYIWYKYNYKVRNFHDTYTALKDFFRLFFIFPPTKETLYDGMFFIGGLVSKFRKKIHKEEILDLLNNKTPSYFNIYSCFFEWILSPNIPLHEISKKNDIPDDLQQVMREIWIIANSN